MIGHFFQNDRTEVVSDSLDLLDPQGSYASYFLEQYIMTWPFTTARSALCEEVESSQQNTTFRTAFCGLGICILFHIYGKGEFSRDHTGKELCKYL